MADLLVRKCRPYGKDESPLAIEDIRAYLKQVPGWSVNDRANGIHRTFEFKNYYETMAFVNALAWVSHREDHHPDIEVTYRRCVVRYATHSIGGLSANDFICAAKLNQVIAE